MKAGLVSVSFRGLCVKEIIRIAAENGLEGIEWGGDIHVKPGEIDRAREVAKMTRDAGLAVTSYGSYYRVGTYGDGWKAEFLPVLESARALGAPTIRVWAYNLGSAQVSEEDYRRIVAETRGLADLCAESGITLAFECHGNTLTDDYHSSLKLMKDVAHPNAKMYWQPNNSYTPDYNREAAEVLRPWLVNVHVFHWPRPGVEEPLENGADVWHDYLDILTAEGADPWCLLEFMPDGRPESLPTESATLRSWLAERA